MAVAKPLDFHRNWRAESNDISIPPCADPIRRTDLEADMEGWLLYYLGAAFPLPWSENHRVYLKQLRACIEQGGFQAVAMPRGEGKTTISTGSMLWGILSGRIRYGLLVGATAAKGGALLKDIKMRLRFSDELFDDYPEVCLPFKHLAGTAMRAPYQTFQGQSTLVGWGVNRLIFPEVPRFVGDEKNPEVLENPSAGAVIDVDGITGDIRGHVYTQRSGERIRPDMAICDDCQTKESAKSPEQSKFRREVIVGDVAGSAGPGQKIGVVVPCTVIYKGDMADTICNREKSPDMRGIRTRMIVSWPDKAAMKIWEGEYNDTRLAGIEAEDEGKMARDYYLEHRETLDRGAEVSWPERKKDDEESGVQHAMNLYLRMGKSAFMSEYQNDPEDEVSLYSLTGHNVTDRVNGHEKMVVPETVKVTAGMAATLP